MASSRVLCGYCIEVNVVPRRSSGPAFAQADLAHYNWRSLWSIHGGPIRPPGEESMTTPQSVPTAQETEHPHIVRVHGVCGGRPIIKGTSLSVRHIAQLYKAGDTVEEIIHAHPHVKSAAVYDAISYLPGSSTGDRAGDCGQPSGGVADNLPSGDR